MNIKIDLDKTIEKQKIKALKDMKIYGLFFIMYLIGFIYFSIVDETIIAFLWAFLAGCMFHIFLRAWIDFKYPYANLNYVLV